MKGFFAKYPAQIAACGAGLLYAIGYMIASSVIKTDAPALFHFYFLGASAVAMAVVTAVHTVRKSKRGAALYVALGLGCLALGRIFVIAAMLASYWTDPISVGFIAEACCYLFLMSALYLVSGTPRKVMGALNILALLAAAVCTASVIANSEVLLIVCVLAFNLICGGLALAAFIREKSTRFFAVVIGAMCVFSILGLLEAMYMVSDAVTPLLEILLVLATLGLREEEKHV